MQINMLFGFVTKKKLIKNKTSKFNSFIEFIFRENR